MRRVIVLRPEPGASATLAKARQLGLDALAVPLFAIEPLAWTVPNGSFDGLLLTSANAVRTAGPGLAAVRALPAYAVGEATAAAAAAAGLSVVATGDSGVEALLGSIDPALRLLHLCGEQRTIHPAGAPSLDQVPTYRAVAVEDPDISALPGNVVLVHSPRAGQRLADLVRDRNRTMIAAISGPAGAAAGDDWEQVAIADHPNDPALLALAARLCNKTDA